MRDGVYKVKSIRLFIQLSRPIFILIAALLYLLGTGIAHYLNGQILWSPFFLGFFWVIFMLLGFQYINEYFNQEMVPDKPAWWLTPFSGGSGAICKERLPRPVALWAGLTCLTVSASLTVLLFQIKSLGLLATIM